MNEKDQADLEALATAPPMGREKYWTQSGARHLASRTLVLLEYYREKCEDATLLAETLKGALMDVKEQRANACHFAKQWLLLQIDANGTEIPTEARTPYVPESSTPPGP